MKNNTLIKTGHIVLMIFGVILMFTACFSETDISNSESASPSRRGESETLPSSTLEFTFEGESIYNSSSVYDYWAIAEDVDFLFWEEISDKEYAEEIAKFAEITFPSNMDLDIKTWIVSYGKKIVEMEIRPTNKYFGTTNYILIVTFDPDYHNNQLFFYSFEKYPLVLSVIESPYYVLQDGEKIYGGELVLKANERNF